MNLDEFRNSVKEALNSVTAGQPVVKRLPPENIVIDPNATDGVLDEGDIEVSQGSLAGMVAMGGKDNFAKAIQSMDDAAFQQFVQKIDKAGLDILGKYVAGDPNADAPQATPDGAPAPGGAPAAPEAKPGLDQQLASL